MSDLSVKLLFSLIVIVAGLLLPGLSYKLLPSELEDNINVSFFWPNTPNEVVEQEVTAVLEGAINTLSEVKGTYTTTTNNYGNIRIEIKDDVATDWARFAISTTIKQIYPSLPKGVVYPQISTSSADDQQSILLNYGLTSQLSTTEIKHFFNRELHRQLASLKGIEKVELSGLPRLFINIETHNEVLANLGIQGNEIRDQLLQAVNQQDLGIIKVKTTNSTLSLPLSIDGDATIATLSQIPIQTPNGTLLKLSDVASLTTSEERGRSLFRINGESTLSFSVSSDKGANQLKLAIAAKKIVDRLASKTSQVKIHPIYDASLYLKRELTQIITRCLFSLGILLLITIVVYRRMRPVLQLFLSLLTSISLAIIVYKLLHIDIHMYALLGLTVSLGFVIDNSIIAIDHFRKRSGKQIILPIIGATLTTICPLLLVLSLESEIRQNLGDFSMVIIINLLASIVVALFLIPAIVKPENTPLSVATRWAPIKALFLQNYGKLITFLRRLKLLIVALLFICLGSPHLFLPDILHGEGYGNDLYNQTIGSKQYQDHWKPVLDRYFGGVLGAFIENSKDEPFLTPPERCNVTVHIHAPTGATFDYIDQVCLSIEQQLKGREGIDLFKTTIYDRNNAQLEAFFQEAYESTNQPARIKGFIEELATNMTGVDITVIGIGKPFSNSAPTYADGVLMMKGYDLNQLKFFAETVAADLLEIPKIAQVQISSEPSWRLVKSPLLTAHYAPSHIDQQSVIASFIAHYTQQELGNYVIDGQERMLRLIPQGLAEKDRFRLQNDYFQVSDSTAFKAAYNLDISKGGALEKIVKKNQQYQLALQVGVNGTKKLQDLIFEKIQDKYQQILPMGFELYEQPSYRRYTGHWKLVVSVLAALFIVFGVCAIIFESLRYALIIIGNIPITFIPILYVLSVLEFGLNQGVFAGLILLVGLLINAVIFIIYEFCFQLRDPAKNQLDAYLSAFSNKIVPILITVLSTMCSLIPFVTETDNHFWYSFSITVLLGLLFSTLAMVVTLPVFLLKPE